MSSDYVEVKMSLPWPPVNFARYVGILMAMSFGLTISFCQDIKSLNPEFIDPGKDDTPVTVKGAGFNSATQIWADCAIQLSTKFVDANTVIATLPKDLLANPQSISLTTTQQPCTLQETNIFVVLGPGNSIKQTASIGQSLIGVNVSAASSVDPHAVFLGSAAMDIPFRSKTDIEQVHWWAGGELKIAGMAQPGGVANLSSQAAFTGFLASATGSNATPDKIVQSAEVSANISRQIGDGWRIHTGVFDSGTKPPDPLTLLTVSVIVKGGAITPLSASQASPPVYEATAQILKTFPNPTNFSYASSCAVAQGATPTCYVAFVPLDRSHFYRHFEAGFRLKIYGEDNADHELRYPGTVDLTVGQNEYVTGGQFHGGVLHLGGTFPVPVLDGFYGFGSMDLALSNKGNNGDQLLLVPSSSTVNLTFTSPSVYTISVGQPNRDRYIFGFGVDFIHLYASIKNKSNQSGK